VPSVPALRPPLPCFRFPPLSLSLSLSLSRSLCLSLFPPRVMKRRFVLALLFIAAANYARAPRSPFSNRWPRKQCCALPLPLPSPPPARMLQIYDLRSVDLGDFARFTPGINANKNLSEPERADCTNYSNFIKRCWRKAVPFFATCAR